MCVHMCIQCAHIYMHIDYRHSHTLTHPHTNTHRPENEKNTHYIKMIFKQDSLGCRELTTRRVGERRKERGKGSGREEAEEGEGKKLKVQAHGITNWRPTWATYQELTTKQQEKKNTVKKLVYNTNHQKPKYQSSWLNRPHLQYVYNVLHLNSSMYNLQFSFHLIQPLVLVFWIFNKNVLLFPRVLFKISFQNVMKYTEKPRHSWVEIVCWVHSRR